MSNAPPTPTAVDLAAEVINRALPSSDAEVIAESKRKLWGRALGNRPVLTIAQTMDMLSVSRSTVEGWIREGAVASTLMGGARRLSKETLLDFVTGDDVLGKAHEPADEEDDARLWVALSVAEAAAETGCHVETVRRHLRSGHMVGWKLGSLWRITRKELSKLEGLNTPVPPTSSRAADGTFIPADQQSALPTPPPVEIEHELAPSTLANLDLPPSPAIVDDTATTQEADTSSYLQAPASTPDALPEPQTPLATPEASVDAETPLSAPAIGGDALAETSDGQHPPAGLLDDAEPSTSFLQVGQLGAEAMAADEIGTPTTDYERAAWLCSL